MMTNAELARLVVADTETATNGVLRLRTLEEILTKGMLNLEPSLTSFANEIVRSFLGVGTRSNTHIPSVLTFDSIAASDFQFRYTHRPYSHAQIRVLDYPLAMSPDNVKEMA